MFGTQETKTGFIQDRQRRSTFQTWQLTCGKRFLVRILDCQKAKLNSSAAGWLALTGKKSTKPNYVADANGFNSTEDINEVKLHICTSGKVLQTSNSKSNGGKQLIWAVLKIFQTPLWGHAVLSLHTLAITWLPNCQQQSIFRQSYCC